MAVILSINSHPETFESDLPDGITGDVAALDLIVPSNVKRVDIEDWDEYEENIDGKWTVTLNNGDEIRIDGYTGMYEVLSWNKLTKKAKAEIVDNVREWAKDLVEYINEEE